MTDPIAHLSPARALQLVAQHGGRHKTAAQLRREAEGFEDQALRCTRLVVAGSTRRKARQFSRAEKAAQHRNNAKLVTLAATEIERRKCETVGEALSNPVVRFVRRLRRG